MNSLITLNQLLFKNVDHIHIINSKQESIIIENRYYRLIEIIIIIINQMETNNLKNHYDLLIHLDVYLFTLYILIISHKYMI